MAIDPRTYDLDELRAASGLPVPSPEADASAGEASVESPAERFEDGPGEAEPLQDPGTSDPETRAADRPAAAAAFERAVIRDVAARDASGGPTERPYLPALPGSLTAEALIFEWLEFLVLQAGSASAAAALSFYESVGWIGSDAATALEAYLSGLNEPRANEDNALDVDDHRVSLHYVARLASLLE